MKRAGSFVAFIILYPLAQDIRNNLYIDFL